MNEAHQIAREQGEALELEKECGGGAGEAGWGWTINV